MASEPRTEEDRLIAKYLEPHTYRPGKAYWRVKNRGCAVWAIIGSYRRAEGPDLIERLAMSWGVPTDAIRAALAYYERHQSIIDTFIEANKA